MFKKSLLAGFALLITQTAMAKDYIIELIIFQQTSRSAGISWQPGVLLPIQNNGLSVFGSAANVGTDRGFVAMETGPALAEIAETLSRSQRYPLIAYRTWQQPGLARDDAQPIRFNVGQSLDVWDSGNTPPRADAQRGIGDDYQNFTLASVNRSYGGAQRRTTTVNGTVTVSLGRYLHLYTDLVFTNPRSGQSTLQKNHRRMRSKRSHYIDNPAFGIIAHITPVEEPEPDESEILEQPAVEDTVDASSTDAESS